MAKKSGKVVVLYAGSKHRQTAVVTQHDLALERILAREASEALEALHRKREMIRMAIAAGAAVEPGARRAELKRRTALVIR